MQKTAGRVLKSSDIKLEGLYRLSATQPGPSAPKQQDQTATTPQARMVESDAEFAIIEVICCCGRKTYIKCGYACDKPVNEGLEIQNEPAEIRDNVTNQTQ